MQKHLRMKNWGASPRPNCCHILRRCLINKQSHWSLQQLNRIRKSSKSLPTVVTADCGCTADRWWAGALCCSEANCKEVVSFSLQYIFLKKNGFGSSVSHRCYILIVALFDNHVRYRGQRLVQKGLIPHECVCCCTAGEERCSRAGGNAVTLINALTSTHRQRLLFSLLALRG